MPWKLGSSRPGSSLSTERQGEDPGVEALAAIQATLSIAKDSVTGLGVPGLEAAVGGLLSVISSVKVDDALRLCRPVVNLDCIQNVKDNNEDLKSFAATVSRFCDTITSPLQTVKISAPWAMTNELQQRLTALTG